LKKSSTVFESIKIEKIEYFMGLHAQGGYFRGVTNFFLLSPYGGHRPAKCCPEQHLAVKLHNFFN